MDPKDVQISSKENLVVVGCGMGSYYLVGTEFQFGRMKIWRWMSGLYGNMKGVSATALFN